MFYSEKKLLVGSDDYGRDLTGVQNLRKKHKRLEGELASHEPAIQAVQDTGSRLAAESNLMQDEIAARVTGLAQNWQELNDMAANRCATESNPCNVLVVSCLNFGLFFAEVRSWRSRWRTSSSWRAWRRRRRGSPRSSTCCPVMTSAIRSLLCRCACVCVH